MEKISMALGVLCILYFASIGIYTGSIGEFKLFWLAVGVFFIASAQLFHYGVWKRCLERHLVVMCIFAAAAAFGLGIFVILESMVISKMTASGSADADYVIVLGARIQGTRITKSLKYRLDQAYDYAAENPDAILLLSGGQGEGEDMPEAQAMKEYLLKRGISGERMLEEKRSVNTAQNIAFCKEIMNERQQEGGKTIPKVLIVSNNFHIYRAVQLAKKQGWKTAEGLAAPSEIFLLPNYMVREAFAILKDRLVGNI